MPVPAQARLHASAVAGDRGGLLILGASGCGKSSLALALIARGARLVSDDSVIVRAEADGLTAGPPEGAEPLIEARGLGILRAPAAGRVPLLAAVDLCLPEAERLPPPRRRTMLGRDLPLFLRPEDHEGGNPPFADALSLYLRNPEILC